MTSTGILIAGLELDAIQEQLNQLIELHQNMLPRDSVEAVTLGKTVKLLSEVEHQLELEAHTA